jgi:predicted PurR-regulated permease PerM
MMTALINWVKAKRPRDVLVAGLVFLAGLFLYAARRALVPFLVATMLTYVLHPLVEWLTSFLPVRYRRRAGWRGLTVLICYMLVLALVFGVLAFVIPPIGAQVEFLVQRLPSFARTVYRTVPGFVQRWLDRYQDVPENIQAALQRGMETIVQTLVSTVQSGVAKTVALVFSTLSFVLGLVVVPLWMFYLLRDQPNLSAWYRRAVPLGLREDAINIVAIVDQVLSSYLRSRLLLGLSMGIMSTVGLLFLRVDFALLLGTMMGAFEIVPLVGPILGAIPILLVTLATAPSNLLWVILLVLSARQIVDYLLLPQVARGAFKIHPALVMLVVIVGSEVAGVWGLILSVPIAAVVRDVARYAVLRLSEKPMSPQEAIEHLRTQH